MPPKPPLELAEISTNTVNHYSFVQIDTVYYSVLEELVGQNVTVKKYHVEIRFYYNNEEVCRHERIFGKDRLQINIYHYLETLKRKPGAIRNSAALKAIPKLKAIFDTHYSDKPKKFIELFIENKELSIKEIIEMYEEKVTKPLELKALDVVKPLTNIEVAVRAGMNNFKLLINAGIRKEASKNEQIERVVDTAKTVPH
jgi:hypothetical protein